MQAAFVANTDPEERWILMRSPRDPLVYPFRTEAEAADFAVEHGMVDWHAERSDDPQAEHQAVCARCNEPWPCEHTQLDREAALILQAALTTCHRCGQNIGGMLIRVEGGGELGEDVSYHGRKGACRNMARRELERLGRTQHLAQLDHEDRIDALRAIRSRVWRRANKEAKERGLGKQEAQAHRMAALRAVEEPAGDQS